MKFLFLLLLLSVPAQAEIYTWVDENGKKHFGDRVPEKYKTQADNVELNMYQPTAEEIAETQRRNQEMERTRRRMESSRRASSSSSRGGYVTTASTSKSRSSNSCADQKARYEEAKRCFAGCQTRVAAPPWQGRRGTVLNNDNCGHCTNVSKPSC